MKKLSKRMRAIREKVPAGQLPVNEAFNMLKEVSTVKFKHGESVDVSVNLGVDPRKSDQVVRGAAVLPNGTGRDVRVAVFAQGKNATAAQQAGADIVGFEDLAADIEGGKFDFDVLIATPDSMRLVGKLGPKLGPRGLMPNPKDGTVTPDVAGAVNKAKVGQVRYRADKAGIVHCTIGKLNFEVKQLFENLTALLNDLKRVKPASAKGIYIKKVTVSSTMGPGIVVDLTELGL